MMHMYEWYLCNSIRSKTREWNKDFKVQIIALIGLFLLDTKLYCRLIYIKLFLAANGIFPILVKLKKNSFPWKIMILLSIDVFQILFLYKYSCNG